MRVVALDVGGTKVAARGGAAPRAVHGIGERTTRGGAGPEDLFADVAGLVAGVLENAGGPGAVAGLGVGCGGPMAGGLVSPLNIPSWRDFPLGGRLTERFGLPVVVDNDAKAMALGEGWVGRAAGCRDFVGLVVSTGVGGGVVLDGRLLDGVDGNAGHVGHVVVNRGGAPCACGARGCVEAESSGTAIAAKAVARRGGRWDARAVAAAAKAGEAWAVDLYAEAGRFLGRGIAACAVLLDLRLAVVGGGVAAAGELLFAPARTEAAACATISYARALRVEPAALGATAGLVGAAALFRGAGARG